MPPCNVDRPWNVRDSWIVRDSWNGRGCRNGYGCQSALSSLLKNLLFGGSTGYEYRIGVFGTCPRKRGHATQYGQAVFQQADSVNPAGR